MQESNRKEREIMGRQHDEDKIEQKKSEVRMNRWYNRLLNRHQDDPVSGVEILNAPIEMYIYMYMYVYMY